MPAPTLPEILKAQPSILAPEEAEELLQTFLTRAEVGGDDVEQLANALRDAVIHLGETHSAPSPASERRLLQWMKQAWDGTQIRLVGSMLTTARAMLSEETTSFLLEKEGETSDLQAKGWISKTLATRSKSQEYLRQKAAAAAEKQADAEAEIDAITPAE